MIPGTMTFQAMARQMDMTTHQARRVAVRRVAMIRRNRRREGTGNIEDGLRDRDNQAVPETHHEAPGRGGGEITIPSSQYGMTASWCAREMARKGSARQRLSQSLPNGTPSQIDRHLRDDGYRLKDRSWP